MADIKISELSSAAILQDADNLELSQDISGTLQSTKVNLLTLGKKIASAINYTSELKTTDKTLTGAINELTDNKVSWVDNGLIGAKNLLKYPYYEMNKTHNGVTYSTDDEGVITAKNTATASANLYLTGTAYVYAMPLPKGKYKASMPNSKGVTLRIGTTNSSGTVTNIGVTDGTNEFVFTVSDTSLRYNFIIQTLYGTALGTGIELKPILQIAEDNDSNWQPYAPTNRDLQLTKPNPEAIATVEYSPTRANHSQGDLIMFNGNLYKCLSAITSGSTLTVGTNIQATKVTDEMGSGSGGTLISGTLTAGSTSITLSDASITSNSWISPYTSVYGVNPTGISVSTGSVTLTFAAQGSDITVGVEVK